MSDIAERLRGLNGTLAHRVAHEAAAEIERLRTELAQTRLDLEYRTAEAKAFVEAGAASRDKALEEAAIECEAYAQKHADGPYYEIQNAAEYCAEAIRALGSVRKGTP